MADGILILVADDNESGRYAKARTLRRAGFEVVEAVTGSEALRVAKERVPRVAVLDVQMPDVDGWEVCRRLKADPETASIAILQVSATYVREEDTVRALEGGADASLTEPIDGPVLIATVRALLRTRAAEDKMRDALVREQAARSLAEVANRAKDEFLATLSHELRSPIGTILTWVTLLRSGKVDEVRTARAFDAIERNARLQAKLIEDLLDVSRIISGKMRLETAPVELGGIIEMALDSVRAAAEAKSIQLEPAIDPDVPPVMGDPSRLQQVVWNLLSNAVKFTAKGGHVQVRVDTADSKTRIAVSDDGRGIEPTLLPHIFERFRQADSSSTRIEGGLGLGLAIVRHLVELHGGTVLAESGGPGQGAKFTVLLPIPSVRPLHPAIQPREDLGASSAELRGLDGLRVLIVDDEQDARDAIAAVLEECGAAVTAAPTVQAGLEALDAESFDVVVSDIAMPIADGYQFIRSIRARSEARIAKTPTLALTAYGSLEERRRVLSAGFDHYLAKPVDARLLVAAVGSLAKPKDETAAT